MRTDAGANLQPLGYPISMVKYFRLSDSFNNIDRQLPGSRHGRADVCDLLEKHLPTLISLHKSEEGNSAAFGILVVLGTLVFCLQISLGLAFVLCAPAIAIFLLQLRNYNGLAERYEIIQELIHDKWTRDADFIYTEAVQSGLIIPEAPVI